MRDRKTRLEEIDKIVGEVKPKPKGPKVSLDNQSSMGDVVEGDQTNITINNHGSPSETDKRYDDSAERQGRKKLSLRQHGDAVDPKHMTPKEYRNFTGGIWDGIERRDGVYNWNAWDWDKGNKPVERRSVDRRVKQAPYSGTNKRKSKRRKEDIIESKMDIAAYYIVMGLVGLTLMAWVAATFFYGGAYAG